MFMMSICEQNSVVKQYEIMALWQRIIRDASVSNTIALDYASLPPENRIPIEVRDVFAQLIEDNVCQIAFSKTAAFPMPSNPDDIKRIQQFLFQLTSEMDAWVFKNNINNDFVNNIRQAIPILKERTTRDPWGLFQCILNLINFELSRFPNPQEVYSLMTQTGLKDTQLNLSFLSRKIRAARTKSCEFHVQSTDLILAEFESQIFQGIRNLSQLQSTFLEQLGTWKLQEQHCAIGIMPENNRRIEIYQLQYTAEQLFKMSVLILKELKNVEVRATGMTSNIGYHAQTVTRLLDELIRSTFVVTQQPIWVVKTKDTKLNMTVCQLIGQSLFREADKNAEVKLSMINEKQAWDLHNQGSKVLNEIENATRCKFNERQRVFEFDQKTNQMVALYNPVQLRSVERAQKRGGGDTHFVMEEKFCFLFTAAFNIFGNSFQAWTTSLPVTVSSHKNQDIFGLGVVIWDYATGGLNRVPFEVSKYLPWTSVAKILSAVFRNMLELEPKHPGLNDDHLNCLKRKAFSNLKPEEFYLFTQSDEISLGELTRRKFGLDLPSTEGSGLKGFSFWDWFCMAIRFLQDKHHKEMWIKGLITGFIERPLAENLLSNKAEGTFLLRFPDSIKGAISVTYVHKEGSQNSLTNLQPYTLKRLELKSLANSIKDLPRLKYIYPSMLPRDEVFTEFYTKPVEITPYQPRSVASSEPNNSSPDWANPAGLYQVPVNSPSDFPWSPSSTQKLPEYNSQSEEAHQGQLQLPSIDFIRNQTLPDHQQLLYSNGNFAYQYNPEPHGGSFAQMETDIGNSFNASDDLIARQVQNVLMNIAPL